MKYQTFRLEIPAELEPHVSSYVTVDIPPQAKLDEILGAFTNFLKASGFAIPEDEFLDFIKEDYKNDYDNETKDN
jgi:hypothetical protein